MRRYLMIAASVAAVMLAIFISYSVISSNDTALTNDEVKTASLKISDGTSFSGKFKCDKEGYHICGYEFDTDGTKLFITLKANISESKALPTDGDGYVEISFDSGATGLKTLYYKKGMKETKLTLSK